MDKINRVIKNMLMCKKIILVVGNSQEGIFIQQRELLSYIDKRMKVIVVRSKKATAIIKQDLQVVNVLGYDKEISVMCENNSYRLQTDINTVVLTHLLETGPNMLDTYIASKLLDSTVMVGILGDDYLASLNKIAIKLSKKSKMPLAVIQSMIYERIEFVVKAEDSSCFGTRVKWNKYSNEFEMRRLDSE